MENQVFDYYLTKIKCIREQEDGGIKRATEEYLVYSVNFSDAEKTIHAVVGSETRGGFSVEGIKKERYADIYDSLNGDFYYNCKIQYVDVNPDNGKEKKITETFLVREDSVKGATKLLNGAFKGMVSNYSVKSVTETKILDIFRPTGTVMEETNKEGIEEYT